jgi:hypothetical protein
MAVDCKDCGTTSWEFIASALLSPYSIETANLFQCEQCKRVVATRFNSLTMNDTRQNEVTVL